MQRHARIVTIMTASMLIVLAAVSPALAQLSHKDYLSDEEADKIRDADTPSLRIKLYLTFAEDRLTKFEYEIHRTIPERHRSDILNSLLNGYAGCMDDAADQIALAVVATSCTSIAVFVPVSFMGGVFETLGLRDDNLNFYLEMYAAEHKAA